jgi:hypothetical protein
MIKFKSSISIKRRSSSDHVVCFFQTPKQSKKKKISQAAEGFSQLQSANIDRYLFFLLLRTIRCGFNPFTLYIFYICPICNCLENPFISYPRLA